MGPPNEAMWRSFGINAGRWRDPQNKCQHPLNSTQHLYFFHDASHAYKNLKEGLLNNVIVTILDEYATFYNLPTNAASSEHLRKLLEAQKNLHFQMIPKLRDEYLDRRSHFQKLRVDSASDLLNHKVSTALAFLAEEEKISELKTNA